MKTQDIAATRRKDQGGVVDNCGISSDRLTQPGVSDAISHIPPVFCWIPQIMAPRFQSHFAASLLPWRFNSGQRNPFRAVARRHPACDGHPS